MPTVPTSLPPPLNASRSFLKALNALSPASVFRMRQQTRSPTTTTKPPMPVHVADMLIQLIDFLEEHHRHEDGLYQRTNAVAGREAREILTVVRRGEESSMPDLAAFSPHAIAVTIKEVLTKDYESLIPSTTSQSLLDRAAGKDDQATLEEIRGTTKRLPPTTRELIKVLMIHLHHLSTNSASRMTATSLAEHIGVLLICPMDVNGGKSTHILKQRQRIARLMIEYAQSLPYNEEQEESPPHTTTPVAVASIPTRIVEAVDPTPTTPAHYVQLMWDAASGTYNEASLQELLSTFGRVMTLAINTSGNRAIASFASADSAQSAAEAVLPGIRIRRRKQRTRESMVTQSIESEFDSPKPSPTKAIESTSHPHEQPVERESATTVHQEAQTKLIEHEQTTDVTVFKDEESNEAHESVDDRMVTSPTFLHRLERPPSIQLVQRAMKTLSTAEHITLEDVESVPSTPQAPNNDAMSPRSLDAINEAPEGEEMRSTEKQLVANDDKAESSDSHLQRRRSLKQLIKVDTQIPTISSSAGRDANETKKQRSNLLSPTIGLISDLKLMLSRKKTPRSTADTRTIDVVEPIVCPAEPTQPSSVKTTILTRSIKTQTKMLIQPLRDQATDTEDLQLENMKSVVLDDPAHADIEKLTLCLNEVHTELTHLAAALNASRQTQVDQAILRAHEHVINRITHALGCNDCLTDSELQRNPAALAASEFVSFLESRSSTQLKILEAEVRAGQELLRLHRTQHQNEIEELEAELTGLRVTQQETEKMCAQLRSELRKCRAELTCHIATAASIQRERRDTDEKRILCETQLRAKDQELLQLRRAHHEMQETAANAQKRLEAYRENRQPTETTPTITRASALPTQSEFPRTTAFLQQHRGEKQQKSSTTMLPVVLRPSQYTNTAALTDMKKILEERIHQQVEVTKQSLRELHVFGQHDTFDDDEMDLEQLEQHLASAHEGVNATMNDSRQQLERLLDPAVRSVDGSKTSDSAFDPTRLVDNLLTKALSESNRWETYQDTLAPDEDTSMLRPVEIMLPSWTHRIDDTQSEMYRNWIRRRPQRDPTQTKPSATRDAHASMLKFQETLATIHKPTPIQ